MQIHADYEPINGDLTPRETEVLAKMAEGLSRDELAAHFHRSRATLNTHIHHIIEKLYARNALHAVAIGIVRGIIHLERMLCLVLVVGLSTAAITPSTAYAADLLDFDITDQPLLRTGRVRVRGRGRTSRRRED